MKKNHHNLLILTVFLFTAMALFFLGSNVISDSKFLFNGKENQTSLTTTTRLPNSTLVKTVSAKNIATPKAWNKSTVYVAGNKITYKKKVFEAKWWTQGETPDSSNEWGPWNLIQSPNIKKDSTQKKEIEKGTVTKTNKNIVKGFKIVGYFPDWQPEAEKNIQYDKLTHINYCFAIPTKNSTIRPLENPDLAKKVIRNGHKKGVKVLIAVGGWSYQGTPLESTFVTATNTKAKCKKLADNILAVVDKYGFDGVDLDWEHPRVDGKSGKQYEQLIQYLRNGLDKRKKLLTSAVLAGVSANGTVLYDAAAHSDNVLKNVNWLNIMAYDGGDGKDHSSYEFAVNSANYWIKTRKLSKSKVVLGVPFYARPSWATYSSLLAADKNASNKDVISYHGVDAYYNGLKTIKNKTNWALKNASGIMIWELSQDTTDVKKSLLNQIYNTALKK